MAHSKIESLGDIAEILENIRKLDKVKERKPGIFYLKSKSFLHFHEKDGRRWADIRDGLNWGSELDIPYNPSKRERSNFLKEAKKRHLNTLGV